MTELIEQWYILGHDNNELRGSYYSVLCNNLCDDASPNSLVSIPYSEPLVQLQRYLRLECEDQ